MPQRLSLLSATWKSIRKPDFLTGKTSCGLHTSVLQTSSDSFLQVLHRESKDLGHLPGCDDWEMMAGVSPWRLGTGLPLRWCPVFPWSTLITGIWHELENPGLSRGFSVGFYGFSINFVHRKRCRISLSRFTITAWWYILTMPSLFHHFTLVESKESKVMILFRNSFCAWRKDLDCFISPKKLKQDRLGIHVGIGERTESGERHGSCNTGLCKEICPKATRFIRIFSITEVLCKMPKKGCQICINMPGWWCHMMP